MDTRRTGVRLARLRAGGEGARLFLFPGTGGDPRELAALAGRLSTDRPVVGVDAYGAGGSVEAMATRAFDAIRRAQPSGPYYLAGYSFGGLVALEVARLARARGEPVGMLALIETYFDQRHWPPRLFAASQLRRAGVQLRALTDLPAPAAARMLLHRLGRLSARLLARIGGRRAAPNLPSATVCANVQALCATAMSAYAPAPYAGAVTLVRAARNAAFGCDVADLWRPFVSLEAVHTIPGEHLDAVRAPQSLDSLARALDERLAAGPAEVAVAPRVLLSTTVSWLSTARLALAFTEAGFCVEALCPPRHALGHMDFVSRTHRRRLLARPSALAATLEVVRPDLVIPCDERAAQELYRLYATRAEAIGDDRLTALIARSLGDPETFRHRYSRARLMEVAGELDLPRPRTVPAPDARSVIDWMARGHGPAVLKTDGSWGGKGVAVIRDAGQAAGAFARLTSPPGLLRVLKRLLIDGDDALVEAFLHRRRAVASVQEFVAGRSATASVACLSGEVLAAVYSEVLCSDGPTGPATVVRVVRSPRMARAVERLVRRLNLSGLCGFDFVLEAETGDAYLLEMNPRATPTCHLVAADGATLAGALFARLTGAARPAAQPAPANDVVALFPQELVRDSSSGHLLSARDDVPWQAPALVELGYAAARGKAAARAAPHFRRPARWIAQAE